MLERSLLIILELFQRLRWKKYHFGSSRIFKNQSIIEFLDPYTGPLICLDKTLGMKCVAHFQIVRFMIRVPKETFNVYIYTLSRIFRYLVCFSEQINCCDLLKLFFLFHFIFWFTFLYLSDKIFIDKTFSANEIKVFFTFLVYRKF